MHTTESLVWLYVERDGGESHVTLDFSTWGDITNKVPDFRVLKPGWE